MTFWEHLLSLNWCSVSKSNWIEVCRFCGLILDLSVRNTGSYWVILVFPELVPLKPGCCFTCGLLPLHLVFLFAFASSASLVCKKAWMRNKDCVRLIDETMENISYHRRWFCIVLVLHKDSIKAQRAVWWGGRGGECFLPTGCSIQCVMEDQSMWPNGGLLQALAETHTNKSALWHTTEISSFLKDQIHVELVSRWDLCKDLLFRQFYISQRYIGLWGVGVTESNLQHSTC